MRKGQFSRMTLAMTISGLMLGSAFCSRKDKHEAEEAMEHSTSLIADLRKHQIPGLPKSLTQEQANDIQKMRKGPGGWFVEKGCFGCHHVSVYGVKSFAAIGPDLSLAQEDVEKRFGKKLDEFWKEPIGTMMIVRTQLIKMTPEEEADGLVRLRKAYADHQAGKATGTK